MLQNTNGSWPWSPKGRKWFSPFGANLYLSMFWRLEQGPAAAIGFKSGYRYRDGGSMQLSADKVRVKWLSNLYLQDRKLAGILVELTGKAGDAAQIVIGAGINMAIRRVEEVSLIKGGSRCRKRESISIVIRWRP
ncbi:hypothetical protein [Escherichia coli]|uniref:hypothetical protein n=1 Tax=Escherichia coli TaxID=562 RepID=UPI003890420E